jgi:hypothetical protein
MRKAKPKEKRRNSPDGMDRPGNAVAACVCGEYSPYSIVSR